MADQLVILIVGQAVRIVVPGQDDGGAVRHSGLLQLIHEVGHGLFQLDVAAEIALARLGIWQVLHLCVVPLRHGIDGGVVFIVAGEGHVIGVELIL